MRHNQVTAIHRSRKNNTHTIHVTPSNSNNNDPSESKITETTSANFNKSDKVFS